MIWKDDNEWGATNISEGHRGLFLVIILTNRLKRRDYWIFGFYPPSGILKTLKEHQRTKFRKPDIFLR
jgi:hypothetical protein